jgi:transcription antitermination factor NusB/nicotinamide-nucleotide adenylyltransferase
MPKKPAKQTLDVRHEARKIALQALFEASFHECNLLEAAERIAAYTELPSYDHDLVVSLLSGVKERRDEIDLFIAKSAPEWPLEQLPKVDLNVLRIAIYELCLAESVPQKVAIDEAVELAKDFSGDSAAGFVNGALGTIIKLRAKDPSISTALFVGRFQPLHKGHIATLRLIGSRFSHIVVVIGSAQAQRTKDNPLSAAERRELLMDVCSTMSFTLDQRVSAGETKPTIIIIDAPDQTSDQAWAEAIINQSPRFGIVYTNHQATAQVFSSLEYAVFQPPLHKPQEFNDAAIRDKIKRGEPWDRLVPTKVYKFLEEQGLVALMKKS